MSKSSSESGGGKKRKFRLALVDDLTQDHIWKVHFTKLGLGVIIASLVILLFILFWCLVAFTPVRTLVPGYPDEQTRAAAATNAAKIDSLEYEITKWNLYSENLRRVLSGEESARERRRVGMQRGMFRADSVAADSAPRVEKRLVVRPAHIARAAFIDICVVRLAERTREFGDLEEIAVIERIYNGVHIPEDESVPLARRPVRQVRQQG